MNCSSIFSAPRRKHYLSILYWVPMGFGDSGNLQVTTSFGIQAMQTLLLFQYKDCSAMSDAFTDDSVHNSIKDGTVMRDEDRSSEKENSSLESAVVQLKLDDCLNKESDSLISFETDDIPSQPEIVRQYSPPTVLTDIQELIARQPSPPPVLAEVQDLIPTSNS